MPKLMEFFFNENFSQVFVNEVDNDPASQAVEIVMNYIKKNPSLGLSVQLLPIEGNRTDSKKFLENSKLLFLIWNRIEIDWKYKLYFHSDDCLNINKKIITTFYQNVTTFLWENFWLTIYEYNFKEWIPIFMFRCNFQVDSFFLWMTQSNDFWFEFIFLTHSSPVVQSWYEVFLFFGQFISWNWRISKM